MDSSNTRMHDFCPYKGLQPYTEDDTAYFFGREREADVIVSNLLATPLTILYASSGVGKTSVLRAAVLPKLRREKQTVSVIFSEWKTPYFISALKRQLSVALDSAPGAQNSYEFEGSLSGDLLTISRRRHLQVLLLFDQFEDYFTISPELHGDFDAELAVLLNSRASNTNILISMREDAISQLDHFEQRIPALFGNMLRLDHLNRRSAEDAITKPVAEYNQQFAGTSPAVSIEDKLVTALLDKLSEGSETFGTEEQSRTGAASPGDEIEAPFLQLVMQRLWDKEVEARSFVLRYDTFETLKFARGIADTHIDDTLERLPPAERDIAASLMFQLVTPSGLKITHTAGDLISLSDAPADSVKPVLDFLSSPSVRFLRQVGSQSNAPDDRRYEVFHDVLVKGILRWRSRYVEQRSKAEAERARQQARTSKLTALVFLVVAVIVTVLAFYAYRQRQQSEKLNEIAESRRQEAELATLERNNLLMSFPYSKAVLVGHGGGLTSAAFSTNGKWVVTSSEDRTARIWEAATGHVVNTLRGHTSGLTSAAFSPDCSYVVTSSSDGTGRVWKREGGDPIVPLVGHEGTVTSAQFSPNGKLIVTSGVDGTARVWAADSGQQVSITRHAGVVTSAQFDVTSRFILTASLDRLARISDASTGELVSELRGHTAGINAAVFSPDGKLVATASRDFTARIWEAPSGRVLHVLQHSLGVNAVSFSHDGKRVVTGSTDGTASVWNVKTGESITKLHGHTNRVIGAAFNNEGNRVVTASEDKTARVWNPGTGREIADLRGHTGSVFSPSFSPDDALVLTASDDNTARLWDSTLMRGFEVVEATIEASPSEYSGPCPVTVRFLARISVGAGSGIVYYRFIRSDGVSTRVRHLAFDSPSSRYVSETWKIGEPKEGAFSGWAVLEISEPETRRTKHASFTIKCVSPPAAGKESGANR